MNQIQDARQNGFSLVEIMIATMILTIGMLSMAASTGYVSKQLKSVMFDSQRTHAKEQVIEKLRASSYASVSNATNQPVGKFSMTWNVTAATNTKTVQLITSGPGFSGGVSGVKTIVDTMYFYLLSP